MRSYSTDRGEIKSAGLTLPGDESDYSNHLNTYHGLCCYLISIYRHGKVDVDPCSAADVRDVLRLCDWKFVEEWALRLFELKRRRLSKRCQS